MSSITYHIKPAYNGDPNGIIDAPKGALFYKTGSFYKLNNSGSVATGWVDVTFVTYQVPRYFLSPSDVALLAVDTGSWLYTKTTDKGTPNGWVLLSKFSPFNPVKT